MSIKSFLSQLIILIMVFYSCNFPPESKKISDDESRALSLLIQGAGNGSGNEQDSGDSESGITLGGTVTGLGLNSALLLQNNFTDLHQVTINGSFTFQRRYQPGSNYAVTVFRNPDGLQCNVLNGVGRLESVNYSGVVIDCN